jgi:uncharacterized protein YjiS (DUF1127 family)
MPANEQRHSWPSALAAPLRLIAKWRQRCAARRGARLHGFTHMSDRMLADIGVRRADVVGALVGAMPLRGAPGAAEPPCDARICALPRRPALTLVADDLDAAA